MTTDIALTMRSRCTASRRSSPPREFWLVKFFAGIFHHGGPAAEHLNPERLSDHHLRDLGFEPRAVGDEWPPVAWRPGTAQRLGRSPLPPI